MGKQRLVLSVLLLGRGWLLPPAAAQPHSRGVLVSRWHDAGFAEAHDSYNAVTAASDGKIYYVICSDDLDTGAQMFAYDPAVGKVTRIGDLTEAVGEKGLKAVPQGKSHVNFYEHQGKLYFATHLGYYQHEGRKELAGVPPAGYRPYPGGHFVAYDLATGKFEDLARVPDHEGIITMAFDSKRGKIYGLTWPSAYFLSYDLASRKLQNHGKTAGLGERGTGADFRVVCRSIAVEPRTGNAYFTVSTGEVMRYDPAAGKLARLDGCSLRRDVFGKWDPDQPGSMAYNWRQTVWYGAENLFYGIHGGSGFLLRFNAAPGEVDVVERIASDKSLAAGMYDSFTYGYLGLTLGPDGHTLYFLTGTPAGEEIRFVTYDIKARKRIDHGALVLEDGKRPTWAQAIAVGRDRRIYTVSKIQQSGLLKVDLLSFADPLQTAPPPEPTYKMIRSWLNPGGMTHPLQEAHGLCFDRQGNVIVVDSIGARVERFTPEGKWLGEIGLGPGTGPGQFRGPRDARVDASGEVYVSDANNYRIQVFSADGKFKRSFGEKGSGPGQLLRAHGLEFSPDGRRLYVVDVDNNRVTVFDPATGKFLFDFGKKGERTGEFHEAHGLGVAPNGDVIVSNYWGPVQRFTADGKFLFEFAPAGFHNWIHFHSMGADREGNIYLAARDRDLKNFVAKFDARGGFVTAWPMEGVKTLAIGRDGLVYAAAESKGQHGVQVFRADR